MQCDGQWIIFNEGRWNIFDDAPIIRARWPTHDGNIVIRGRALMVMAVALLLEGGIIVGGGEYYYYVL